MNTCIYDAFGRGVCVHDNLKTIADICCLLAGGYTDWRKISYELARQDYRSRTRSRSYFGGFKTGLARKYQ